MNHKLSIFVAFAVTGLCGPILAAASTNTAHQEVAAAIAAMGGKDVLTSVHTLKFAAIGHRNMLEQSLRPAGPWWQDYFQLTEIRDFTTHSERVSQKHRGYSSPDWWLDHRQWDSDPYYPVYVVDGGAAAQIVDGKYSRYGSAAVKRAEEDFAFGPARVLFTALAAADLKAAPDVTFHGFMHHVVTFTWNGYPVRLYLNSRTGLPEQVEWTRPRPYDVFWNVWGDVTTRVTYGMWALQPEGLRFPRQWTTERNGMPDSDMTITSLTVNPKVDPKQLHIPDKLRRQYIAKRRTIADIPLGIPGKPATEIEPGIVHIPGYWNINLIRQDDGIVVLEGPISSAYSVKVLDEARKRFPKLPVKAVVTTSDAWPHLGGMREYAARGIPIYALDLDKPVLERLFAAPHTFRPDDLQKHPRKPKWRLVTDNTALGTGANRIELVPYRTETGERQMLVYFPQYKLLYTSDLFAPGQDARWFTPEYLLEVHHAVAREHLTVDKVFGMHYDVTPWKTLTAALDAFRAGKPKPAVVETHLKQALRPLGFFAGQWSCAGHFNTNGKAIASTETFTADLDGNWLRMRHDDRPPHSFHALEMWGYDKAAKRFTGYVFDNFSGARRYTSSGWQGDRLTWRNASADAPTDRFVFKRHGSHEYRVTYARSRDGKVWRDIDTLICKQKVYQ